MANILGDDTQQQVLALGRLGWPLRRIEAATGVRRETASAYLKAAGIPSASLVGAGRRRQIRPVRCPPTSAARPARTAAALAVGPNIRPRLTHTPFRGEAR